MTYLPSSAPANYATQVYLPRADNLAYPGDALTVTAKTAGNGTSAATSWVVRDFDGTQIATGSWSGQSQTIGTAGSGSFANYGWYTFHLKGPDRGDNQWADDYGTCRFVIGEVLSGIPTAALRASNPANLTDGLDAPYAHGPFSLGGARISLNAQNIQSARQTTGGHANAATSVAVTIPSYTVTSASMTILVHTVVGDNTGAAGPVGWTLAGSQSFGSSTTKVSVYVYQRFATGVQGDVLTCTTTNAADQALYFAEDGPYIANQAPVAVQWATGNGTTASITKDLSAQTFEYEVISGVAQASGTITGGTASPDLGFIGSWGGLSVNDDSVGTGQSISVTYNLSTTTNYIGFIIAYAGQPGAFGAYSTAAAQDAVDMWWTAWGQYADANRPYRQVTVATVVRSIQAVTNYAGKIAQIVSDTFARHTGFIGAYTGRNEPGSGFTVAEARIYAAAVKNGNGSAKAGGPGFVSMNSAWISTYEGLVDGGVFAVDALDVDTYHDYNMTVADTAVALSTHRAYKASRVARSLTNDIYMTEGSHNTSGYPGFLWVRCAGTHYILNTLAREILLGVPYERQNWYHDRRGGYTDELAQMSDGGVFPGYAMHRAMACRLYGKQLEGAMSFGDWYDRICLGGTWRNPTDDTGVAAVIGCVGMPAVTFGVSPDSVGTVPSTLIAYDAFGNTSTITVTNRSFTLTPSDTVQYIALPAGVTVAPRTVNHGLRLLTLVPAVTIADSGNGAASGTNLARLKDDNLLSPIAGSSSNFAGDGGGYQTANNTFPRTLAITFNLGATVTGDTIAAYCSAAWLSAAPPLKGKLQYTTDGSNWLDAYSWDNTTTVTVMNYNNYEDSLYDAHSHPQHYFEGSLGGQVTVKGVRMLITTGCRGLWVDSTMTNPRGGSVVDDGYAPINSYVNEIAVFNKGANVPLPAMTG